MERKVTIRTLNDLLNVKFKDEKYKSVTSKEQINVEIMVQKYYERFEQLHAIDWALPKLYKDEHFRFLNSSIQNLSMSYECLDCSRPWLVYWTLNSVYLMNYCLTDNLLDHIIEFLIKCRSVEGGFGGGPAQYPHLATTYAAVNALCIIGTPKALDAIDKESLKNFLLSVREPNGAFRMHVNGELDVRGAYCAISAAKLVNFSPYEEEELFHGTANWIASCQTYEGGFGGTPDLEAHGGYTFCAIAALALLGKFDLVNLNLLLRWTVHRQMRLEGGFQGRTNKLVDGCYSFWQGAAVPVIQRILAKVEPAQSEILNKCLFNRQALQEYILICCQKPSGGLIDKPGKPADLYHTCYTLSGLSMAQHSEGNLEPFLIGDRNNELLPSHPLHNIPPNNVLNAFEYFNEAQTVTEIN